MAIRVEMRYCVDTRIATNGMAFLVGYVNGNTVLSCLENRRVLHIAVQGQTAAMPRIEPWFRDSSFSA